jgi:hypothetical protein
MRTVRVGQPSPSAQADGARLGAARGKAPSTAAKWRLLIVSFVVDDAGVLTPLRD